MLVVTTKRPPTKIGDESTVPGMSTDTRARVVAFDAVIPVGALETWPGPPSPTSASVAGLLGGGS